MVVLFIEMWNIGVGGCRFRRKEMEMLVLGIGRCLLDEYIFIYSVLCLYGMNIGII